MLFNLQPIQVVHSLFYNITNLANKKCIHSGGGSTQILYLSKGSRK